MKNLGILHQKPLFSSLGKISGQIEFGNPNVFGNMFLDTNFVSWCHLEATFQCRNRGAIVTLKESRGINLRKIKSMLGENGEELSDDEDELCPVECVREFQTDTEFSKILEMAAEENSLVVVDFYRTSCGSCKYIEQGFVKLCKGSGDKGAPVVFLKHNVIDEYDEQSEVAERLRIKTVPLFHFYKNGVLLEAFATRDKERILAAILKYTAPASQEVTSIS